MSQIPLVGIRRDEFLLIAVSFPGQFSDLSIGRTRNQTLLEQLPPHLKERTRWISEQSIQQQNGSVLYWMRNALRIDENPALEVAKELALQLNLPLLIYQGLSERYKFASDRHHTFILEGARDVQAQAGLEGLSYVFHLERPDDRRPHLLALAERAAVVLTEDMPGNPAKKFLARLATRVSKPILAVDTACIYPMQLTGRAYTRAFEYRDATREGYESRISFDWARHKVDSPDPFPINRLEFQPLDLGQVRIDDLVASCEIDHSVGPVRDTPGGSSPGYERWSRFLEVGLQHYAARRNNALQNGVSRISAYLHYGMVSPTRIAREAKRAADLGNTGADKYLDELLIWRELAYAFCFHRHDHDSLSAIPVWAQQTLMEHAEDPRLNLYSWEQLARGETHSQLWNAAQHSLVRHGELHNNLRMTWGKAILQWTESPQEALQMIRDLNHRFALDGRDPASYGGILWCLGQFDRPFTPEQSVLGTVRPRPIEQHAKRLDPTRYQEKIRQPRVVSLNVAVVGAGLSGLMAARILSDHGHRVTVFEKSRGVGGRMAIRRTETATFDHGAQYFTVRDPRFARYCESWAKSGLISQWPNPERGADQQIVVIKNANIENVSDSITRYVGSPAMNAICKVLAGDTKIEKNTRITKVDIEAPQICLESESGHAFAGFDRLIVTAPPEQAAELLQNLESLRGPLSQVEMSPCYAAMATLPKPVTDQWVGAFIHDSFLSWAARNQTKPNRESKGEQLVLHAQPDWTWKHWEHDPQEVANAMLEEFWRVSGANPQNPTHLQSHRWKYSIPNRPNSDGVVFDRDYGIVCSGDWACGARVEGAFLSGMAAAGRILGTVELIKSKPRQTHLF